MDDTQYINLDLTGMAAKIRALAWNCVKQACLDQDLDDETATRIADETVKLMERPQVGA